MASSTTIPPPSHTSLPPPTCTTATPDQYGHVPPTACNANYGFYPSWEWNLVFAVIFGMTSIVHIAQAAAFKKPYCWVVIMGSLWECACFALRTLGAHDQQNTNYVIVSTLLFLLAPLWINAFVYMTVARLAHLLVPERKTLGVPAVWLAKAFVAADVLTFLVQAVGGGLLADQEDRGRVTTGQHVYMTGIAVQMVFVLVFVVFAVALQRRLTALRRGGSEVPRKGARWVLPLGWVLLAVLGLIVVRIVFRLVEFSGGVSSENPILANEAYQMGLDALPMVIALGLLNAVHPGFVLAVPDSTFPPWWKVRGGERKGVDAELQPLPAGSAHLS